MDDTLLLQAMFSPNDWETVNENDNPMVESNVKTPEEFHKEVEELRKRFNLEKPNLWEAVSKDNQNKH